MSNLDSTAHIKDIIYVDINGWEDRRVPKFLLIGAGPFAQSTYISYLKQLEKDGLAQLKAIVEILFVPPFTFPMPNAVRDRLTNLVTHLSIDCVIISTEPLAHKAYGIWAINQGLNVIMDKPITTRKGACTDEAAAKGIAMDYKELADAYAMLQTRKKTCYLIQSHRRYHPGFQFVLHNIHQLCEYTACPIISLASSHCDGIWRMPEEIMRQEYHTFKDGYGKLSHSGYHLLDVCSKFLQTSWLHHPGGFYTVFNRTDYERIFGADYVRETNYTDDELWRLMDNMGGVDCGILMTAFRDDHPICLVQLNLLHTGFSRRSSFRSGTDLYRGVGRVKHETHDIKCGPFQTMAVESRKSKNKGPSSSLGGDNHFDVNIFQNSGLLHSDASAVQSYTMEDILRLYPEMAGYVSTNVKRGVLEEALEFMAGNVQMDDLKLNLPDHELPAYIMSAAYLSHVRKRMGQNPVVEIMLDSHGL